jgi:hypothetical protein
MNMKLIGRYLRTRAGVGGLLVVLLVVGSAPSALTLGDLSATARQAPAWNEVPLQPGVYREHRATYRTDSVDVPVGPNGGEIEYMVNMKQGEAVVYSWRALEISDAQRLTSEFHGHTDRAPGTTGTLVFYRKATGASESGSLIAPFDGTHGWYLKNDTASPIVVRLTIAGFYEVIPNQIRK